MGIEQAFGDQTLLDVVSLLSARNESGRLKIAGGTMRGAFFFSKGKLVDAHMGPLSGFQAVNLAISVGKARLSFDPSIESQISSFKVPAERIILKERFGIETDAPEGNEAVESVSAVKTTAVNPPPPPSLPRQALPRLPQPKAPTQQDAAPQQSVAPKEEALQQAATSAQKALAKPAALPKQEALPQEGPLQQVAPRAQKAPPKQEALPRQPTPKIEKERLESAVSQARETQIRKVRSGSRTELFVRGVAFDSSRRNGVLLACVVLLIAGLGSYWINNPEIEASNSTAGNTAEPSQAPQAAPALSQPAESLTKALPASEPVVLRPQTSPVTTEQPIQKIETNGLDPEPVKEQQVAEMPLDAKVQPVEPPVKPSSLTIPVVVEIEEGRVTEASIPQPQRGLAAYEATALRLARQRRFSSSTTRRETITVHVTREP